MIGRGCTDYVPAFGRELFRCLTDALFRMQ